MPGIRGKVTTIAGASSGIGRAAALLLAARGAQLVPAGREPNKLEVVARGRPSGRRGGAST